MTLEKEIAGLLIHQRKTLAVAESCSGGLLCQRLTNITGSSKFLIAGIVAYNNIAKTRLLRVPKLLISKHGAVSQPVAIAMAQGIRQLFKTNFGISITGIAGPTGGSAQKPLGLTYIALTTPKISVCQRWIFKGNRLSVKTQATTQTLNLLLKFLE
jgi:nicotinamide-nucleotide amidase